MIFQRGLLNLFIFKLILSTNALYNKSFPDGFLLGTATSSYQIEGAWNVDGKGESIWDHLTHYNPEYIDDGTNGDIACDSYNRYLEDVEMLENLGADFYRFSLSWPRILPNGVNKINQKGIDYYNKLINALLAKGIKPMVTIYHWDLPQYLQNIGGWTNPKMIDYFANFARIVFEQFGDRVPYWTTFNEPIIFCLLGYGGAVSAPVINSSGIADYLCLHHVLKAHAKVYHIYDEEFRPQYNGNISIVMPSHYFRPASNSTRDLEAHELGMQFYFGIITHPIYHPDGNYPDIVISRIANRSSAEGFRRSRLPTLTPEEIDYIKGTYDYFGLNHYTTWLTEPLSEAPIGEPDYYLDWGITYYMDQNWTVSANGWLAVVPSGFRELLNWIKERYNNPPIIVTENGYSDTGETDDQIRLGYYKEYLSALLEAVYEDNVDVVGYAAWSLMDNFEWASGYMQKFGIYSVDFNDPNRTRTEKTSAKYYKQVLATRCLLESGDCDV